MNVITGATISAPDRVAFQNVLALNTGMFDLYGNAGQIFQGNILASIR